jgi:hypothetical protein
MGIVDNVFGIVDFIAAHGHSVIILKDPICSTDSTIRKKQYLHWTAIFTI